jgi:CRP/FNR family cyclic AMP-dependent transcriptional regulator
VAGQDRDGATGWHDSTLLGRLEPAGRAALLALGRPADFPPAKVLLRQGDLSQHSYLLLRGYVKVTALAENGGEALLGIRTAGDLIGEMAVLGGQPRSASVQACTPVHARVLPVHDLTRFLEQTPAAGMALSRMISERLRWANDRRLDFAAFPAATRLARVLLYLAETYGHPVPDGLALAASLTQRDLASLAGIKLPTAEKALRVLHDSGVVGLGRDLATV